MQNISLRNGVSLPDIDIATLPRRRSKPRGRALGDYFPTAFDKFFRYAALRSSSDPLWRRGIWFVWMPFAFLSGIRPIVREIDEVLLKLPFRWPNRNLQGAIGGGAILGNAELAGGYLLFHRFGGDYAIVCNRLDMSILSSCEDAAIYRVTPCGPEMTHPPADARSFKFDVNIDVIGDAPKPYVVAHGRASYFAKRRDTIRQLRRPLLPW